MSGDQMPVCTHVWEYRHQMDFPAEIFWVQICKICLEIDGEALGQQIAGLRDKADQANGVAAVAIATARETRAWAESIAEQVNR